MDVVKGQDTDTRILDQSLVTGVLDAFMVSRTLADPLLKCPITCLRLFSLKSTLDPILQNHSESVKNGMVRRLPPVQYATNPLTQFLYCSQRTLRNLIRNPAVSVLQVGGSYSNGHRISFFDHLMSVIHPCVCQQFP